MVTSNRVRVVASWLLFAAFGCEAQVDRNLNGLSCSPEGACADGYVCRDGKCVSEPARSENAQSTDASVALTEDGASPPAVTHEPPQVTSGDVGAPSNIDDAMESSTRELPSRDTDGTTQPCTACASGSSESSSAPSVSSAASVSSVDIGSDATNIASTERIATTELSATTEPSATTESPATTEPSATTLAPNDAGASCTSETCADSCPTGFSACGDECYNLDSDVRHCGLCDRACSGPQEAVIECRNRGCVVTCPDPQELCGDECVDFLNDSLHCGDCNTECKNNKTCIDGSCRVK